MTRRNRLNPILTADLEAILEAHWHPATEKPPCRIPTTTSTEAETIRRDYLEWIRIPDSTPARTNGPMERHEARRVWLMAGFSVALAFVAIWIMGGR
jgi:hypothetical protein